MGSGPGLGGAPSPADPGLQPLEAGRPRGPDLAAPPGHRPGGRDVLLRHADPGPPHRGRRRRPRPGPAVRRPGEDRQGPGRRHLAGPGVHQPQADRRGGRPVRPGPAQPAAAGGRGHRRAPAHLVAGRPPVRRHQRLSIHQRMIALGFAFGSVVVVVLTLGIMVDAPFMDENRATDIGVSRALVTIWYVVRWPVVLLVLVAFLLCLYRFAPSVRHAWRHLLPGAVLGVLAWIAAAVGFRIYLALSSDTATGVVVNDQRVVIIGRAVEAVVATVLWTYFSSVAILVGNELNAELARLRNLDG